MSAEVSLRVVLRDEVLDRKVLISRSVMTNAGIADGKCVQVRGRRVTVATAAPQSRWRRFDEDSIQMDHVVLRNADVGQGELVDVRKIKLPTAEQITLARSQVGMDGIAKETANLVLRACKNRPYTEGDHIIFNEGEKILDL